MKAGSRSLKKSGWAPGSQHRQALQQDSQLELEQLECDGLLQHVSLLDAGSLLAKCWAVKKMSSTALKDEETQSSHPSLLTKPLESQDETLRETEEVIWSQVPKEGPRPPSLASKVARQTRECPQPSEAEEAQERRPTECPSRVCRHQQES